MNKFIAVLVCLLSLTNPIMAFAILNSVDMGEFETPIAEANEPTLLEEPINCPESFTCQYVQGPNSRIQECKVSGVNQKYFMPFHPTTTLYNYEPSLLSSAIGYKKESDIWGQAICTYWTSNNFDLSVEFRTDPKYLLRPTDDGVSGWTERKPARPDGAIQRCDPQASCDMELPESQIVTCGTHATCTEEGIKYCHMEGGDVQFFTPEKSNSNGVVIDHYTFAEAQVASKGHSVRCKYQTVYSDGMIYGISFVTKFEYDAIPHTTYGNWTTHSPITTCGKLDTYLCPILATSRF
jgi:hypothetical protein